MLLSTRFSLISREYRAEYMKLRDDKLREQKRLQDEKLKKIAQSKGSGREVNLTGFVNEV